MKKLAAIVPDAIRRTEVLRAGRAMRFLRQWPEVVGPLLALKSMPDRYDRGTVWVATTGSAWAQELRMLKTQILERLRAISNDPTLFVDIRFGVRPLPEEPTEEAEVEDLRKKHREALEGLSIAEIKERRLSRPPDKP